MKLCTETRKLDFFRARKIRPAPEPLDCITDFEFQRGENLPLCILKVRGSLSYFGSTVLKWASGSLCHPFVTDNVSESVGKLLATVYTGWGKSRNTVVPMQNTVYSFVTIYYCFPYNRKPTFASPCILDSIAVPGK